MCIRAQDTARLRGVVASKSELDEVRDFSADDGTLAIGTYAKVGPFDRF